MGTENGTDEKNLRSGKLLGTTRVGMEKGMGSEKWRGRKKGWETEKGWGWKKVGTNKGRNKQTGCG